MDMHHYLTVRVTASSVGEMEAKVIEACKAYFGSVPFTVTEIDASPQDYVEHSVRKKPGPYVATVTAEKK